jgi:hypothetical protein
VNFELVADWPTVTNPLLSDPGFADQWALENTGTRSGAVRGADTGFARAQRIAPLDALGMMIAVLDYAIDVAHPELEASSTRSSTRRAMTWRREKPILHWARLTLTSPPTTGRRVPASLRL